MAVPNHAKQQLLEGAIDVTTDTLRLALFDDSTAYTFDTDTHEFVNDVLDGGTTAQEMSGAGYSRKDITTPTTTQDDTDDEGVFDGDNVTFTGLDAGTIQGILIYKQVGGDDTTPGDDPILVVLDDDSAGSVADLPLATNGSDVEIQWDAEGIVNIA